MRPGAQDAASSPAPLADREARDLIAAAIDRSVFVDAGAGSGKTRHLVERVCRVLTEGVATVEEIALITFTEAAAGELRDRLAAALEAIEVDAEGSAPAPSGAGGGPAQPGAGGGPPQGGAGAPGPAEVAARAREALAGLDAAAITTLHGFARRILAEHPFDAGVPPAFEVLDAAQSLADLDEHWPALLEGLLGDPRAAQAVQWALVAGSPLSGLRAVARKLGDHWDALTRGCPPAASLPALDPGPVLAPLRRALALRSRCADPADKLLGHLERLSPYAADLEEARGAGDLAVLGLLVHPPSSLTTTLGRAGAWGDHKPEVRRLLEEAESARAAATTAALGAAAQVVVRALGALVVGTARRRQREGRLHFHDLLVLACELARERPAARRALHDRYRRLFVDEFQDTDPLQAELVTLIAADPAAPAGSVPWSELPTVPGALFLVGDPLQSIYAFRRADVGTFLGVRELPGFTCASLVTNFRSASGIVDWVNAVFSTMVGAGEDRLQPAYAPQQAGAGHSGLPAGPVDPVTVLGLGSAPPERAWARREAEARDVAAALERAIEEGWPAGAGGRPVQLDDIAVLVRSRTVLPALEAALEEAGLAYRLEASSLVYSAPEVQDLLHVLRAIDDPADEASVVAALRTPGFGCGDDDLLRHRLAGGSWDYTAPAGPGAGPSGDDPVREGFAALRAWHERRSFMGVSELVAAVLEERRHLAAALDGPRWREEWRRLRFVADQARQFTEGSPGSLGRYLAWVDVQREGDARVTEVVLPETDTPAITVMTVHAAKGLEFPVVAVVGFGGARPAVRAPAVLSGTGGLELSLGRDVTTPGFADARERADALAAHEEVRLLYVAVTRAMRHLFVSVHGARAADGRTVVAQLEVALEAAQARPGPHATPVGGGPATPDGTPARRARSGTSARAAEPRRAEVGGRPPDHDGQVDDGRVHDGRVHEGQVARAASSPVEHESAEELARWADRRAWRLEAPPRAVAATGVAKLVRAAARGGAGSAVREGAPLGAGADVPSGPDADSGDWPADPLEDWSADASDEGRADGERAGGGTRWRRGRGGTAVGRAVHSVLQEAELGGGDRLDELAAVHAAAEGVPDRASEVAALAAAALGSDVVREAARSRHWRELYVGTPVGDRVLEGFVDLLFEGPDGLEVVDYKTDRVDSDRAIEGLVAAYRLQGAAYAAAVAATLGRPVVRCTFLFLRARGDRPSAVERPIGDLDAAVSEVLAALGSWPEPPGRVRAGAGAPRG